MPPGTGALSVVSAHCERKPRKGKSYYGTPFTQWTKFSTQRQKLPVVSLKIYGTAKQIAKTSLNPCAFLFYSKRDQLKIPGFAELIAGAIAAVPKVVRARVPYVPLFVANATVRN